LSDEGSQVSLFDLFILYHKKYYYANIARKEMRKRKGAGVDRRPGVRQRLSLSARKYSM
jgi:hypothetical protein